MVRDACLVAQVSWLRDRDPVRAVPLLVALEDGGIDIETREWAGDELDRQFENAVARGPVVDLLFALGDRGPAPDPIDVAAWEARLGSPDFAERDTASADLAARGAAALPILTALRRSEDAEVRARVEELVLGLGHENEAEVDEE